MSLRRSRLCQYLSLKTSESSRVLLLACWNLFARRSELGGCRVWSLRVQAVALPRVEQNPRSNWGLAAFLKQAAPAIFASVCWPLGPGSQHRSVADG